MNRGIRVSDYRVRPWLSRRGTPLGYRTPAEYAAGCSHTHHPVACNID